jgi:hypothetical protein
VGLPSSSLRNWIASTAASTPWAVAAFPWSHVELASNRISAASDFCPRDDGTCVERVVYLTAYTSEVLTSIVDGQHTLGHSKGCDIDAKPCRR